MAERGQARARQGSVASGSSSSDLEREAPLDDALDLFVACGPGLEPMLASELQGLVPGEMETIPGGVALQRARTAVARIARGSGLGIRLLQRIARFPARHFSLLERGCRGVDWKASLPRRCAVEVRAHAKRSKLYHTGAIEQRVRRIVEEALGTTGETGTTDDLPVVRLQVRLENDDCTLSLDLGGGPLQHRGYRLAVGKAPLREDLAYALLLAAGYHGQVAVFDPLCGSGTIAIEAARRAAGVAPGAGRAFAFERLPGFSAAEQPIVRAGADLGLPIHASDRDAGAVDAARANAARAGVGDRIAISQAPLSKAPWPDAERILLVCNPPYGRRLRGPGGLRDLYAALGNLRRKLGDGARLALITSDPALARATEVRLESAFLTDLGGLKVRAHIEP